VVCVGMNTRNCRMTLRDVLLYLFAFFSTFGNDHRVFVFVFLRVVYMCCMHALVAYCQKMLKCQCSTPNVYSLYSNNTVVFWGRCVCILTLLSWAVLYICAVFVYVACPSLSYVPYLYAVCPTYAYVACPTYVYTTTSCALPMRIPLCRVPYLCLSLYVVCPPQDLRSRQHQHPVFPSHNAY
jgi:hypothetical protein